MIVGVRKPSRTCPTTISVSTAFAATTRGGATFEKPATLIKVGNKNRVLPRRPPRKSIKNSGQKSVPIANICMRMVIITTAVIQECVAGVNIRNTRQCANCGALQEFGKKTSRERIFETPERGKRQISE